METLNSRLKYARAEKSSQTAKVFAREIGYGCTVAKLVTYETCGTAVPSDIVSRWSAVCDTNECWLLTGEGEKFRKHHILPDAPWEN